MKKHFNKRLKKFFSSSFNKSLDKYKNILPFEFWNLLNKNKNNYFNYLNKRNELLKEVIKLDMVNQQKFYSDIVWSFKDKIMSFYDIKHVFDDSVFCEISPEEYIKKCKQAVLNFCEYTSEFSMELNKTEQKLAEIKKMKQLNNPTLQTKSR